MYIIYCEIRLLLETLTGMVSSITLASGRASTPPSENEGQGDRKRATAGSENRRGR